MKLGQTPCRPGMEMESVDERSRAQVQADIDRANPALRQAGLAGIAPHVLDGLQLEQEVTER